MNTRSKTGLFLIELIIVITIFAMSAAVCLRLFFQSRVIADESRNLSRASLEVLSVADCYKSADGSFDMAADLLGCRTESGVLTVYYDADWARTGSADGASFKVEVVETQPRESRVTALTIDGDDIFSVNVRGGMDLG